MDSYAAKLRKQARKDLAHSRILLREAKWISAYEKSMAASLNDPLYELPKAKTKGRIR